MSQEAQTRTSEELLKAAGNMRDLGAEFTEDILLHEAWKRLKQEHPEVNAR